MIPRKRGKIKENKFAPLSSGKVKNFHPESIVHIYLTMKGALRTKSDNEQDHPNENQNYKELLGIRFYAYRNEIDIKKNEMSINKTRSYISDIENGFLPPPSQEVSPYDMWVNKQCIILVQLDKTLDKWQFSKEEHGCTTKKFHFGTRNWGLTHYYGNGNYGKMGDTITGEDCRMLYFGVVKRGSGKSEDPVDRCNPSSELFNIHIEFKQTDTDSAGNEIPKRLQVIFDPDVKNNGGKFPPTTPPEDPPRV